MGKIYEYEVPFDRSSQVLPIEIKFNFAPFINHMERAIEEGIISVSDDYLNVLKEVKEKGVLDKPFSDISFVQDNMDDISRVMKPVFPEVLTLNEIKAIILPFSDYFINPSRRLQNILKSAGKKENITFQVEETADPYIGASILVLNLLYGAGIDFGSLYHFNVTDEETGLTRCYRSLVNADFASLYKKPDAPTLTPEEIRQLKSNINDVDLWMEKVPPGSHVFEGIGILTLLDVTRERQESHIKNLLLKNDVLDDPALIEELIQLFRSYLGIPDLELGLVAYDNVADRTKPMGFGLWKSILLKDDEEACSIQQLGPEVIDHLKNHNNELLVEMDCLMESHCDASKEFKKRGIGSYGLFPLSDGDEMIALIEMSSRQKGKLDKIVAKKFDNIKALFTTAIKRYLNQYDVNLEAIIKEKCTAIHPSVEWKFKEEAELYYRNKLNGETLEMEDIDFPGVHPLYGQIDIKDSSIKRNAAIKNDLMDQLKELRNIVENAYLLSNLPYYGQLLHTIKTKMSELGLGLGVGDEVAVLDFIKQEVEPNLEHISSINDTCKVLIEKYHQKLKSESNAFTKRRNQYEKSVADITGTITDMMVERQLIAQEMFPHYYEKYKTDGVEHNIYIGDSLVKGRKYFDLYLKNIRLWQLMTIIEIENRLKQEQEDLKVKLDVCSLVLVHSNPITIRFRMDEKKFDVEGAYNIRYEIIKKRIDKSLIQKTKERLTQPGKLAIVFAHAAEEREYMSYLSYLESIGYIKPGIEVLELSPVQGINGLRALRVSINYDQGLKLDQSIEMIEATLN